MLSSKIRKLAALAAALTIVCAVAYVAHAGVPHTWEGDGYGMLVDGRDHCIVAWSNAALPAVVTSNCQAGALLWRSDTSTLYSLASGSWSAITLTGGVVTVTGVVNSGNETVAGTLGVTGATSLSSTEGYLGTHGESWTCGWGTELLTLSTSGTTTDTSANLLPANSIILAVTGRVTTTITASCTGWELGDGTSAARFTANDTTLTANETKVGITQFNGNVSTTALGPTQAAAAAVRVTCAGGNPGAGIIRISVFSCTGVAPTS